MMKTLKVLGIDKALKIVLSIVLAVSIITPLQHVYATTDGEEPVVTETTGTETTEVQNTADTQKVDEEQQIENPTETEVTYEVQNTEAPVTTEATEPAETPASTEPVETNVTEGNSEEVLAPEVTEVTEEEYELHIFHYLSIDLGDFYKEEVITLKKSNLEYGYEAVNNALSRTGLELLDETVVVGLEDFDEELYGEAWLQYKIADGYKAVLKEGAELTSTFSSAQYIGQLDDIEIVPNGQKGVKFSFEYENGTLAEAPETITLDEDKVSGKYTGTYTIKDSYIPTGYNVTISDVTGATLSGKTVSLEFDDSNFVEIKVIFVGDEHGSYKVLRRYEQLDGTFSENEETVTDVKVGSETQVEANTPVGYSVEAFDQAYVAGDGSTVITITYYLNNYTVTYNSNGGSYVASQSGKYGETKNLYNEGTRVLDCKEEEHTHTYEFKYKGKYYGGCYSYSGGNNLICGKTEHTHSDKCYKTVDEHHIPTKTGYTFAGWYLDEGLTTPAPETAELAGNMTLYAKWEAATVNYTVAYFKENVNGGYDYIGSSVKEALVGSTVSGSDTAGSFTNSAYYHYNSERTQKNVTVNANGTTIVNVYYDLNTYTLVFDLDDSNAKLTIGDKTYTGSNYSFTAKLGEDISDR